ncbi:MAG: hypothetical protein M3N98_08860 [Actinomycetota bacterium]|nr:hypothetical protein [Actinomycetota bacterium]
MREWPPSASERRQIDTDYSVAVAAAQEEEGTYRAYVQERDLWVGSHAPEFAGLSPVHECLLMLPGNPGSEAAFEELDPDGQICGALTQDGRFAFGSTEEVIVTITGLPTDDPWVGAVCRALDRERAWDSARRSMLGVHQSDGEMFHVTAAQNRASILRYGLDWRRMGATHGIAGSREPELPVVFLCDNWADVSFFTAMARSPSDVWGVRVDGLWAEPGPDGWTIVAETVPPDRLRIVESDLPVTRHR